MKITVEAHELIRGLLAVMPHAHDNKTTLPMINAVHFQMDDERLYLAATDRYTLGVYHMPARGDADFSALLALRDVRDLLSIAKMGQAAWKAIPTDVELIVSDRTLKVVAGMQTHLLKGQLLDGTFPPYKSLLPIPGPDLGTADQLRAFNPALLAKFAKAGDKGTPMLCWAGSANKPMLVTVGSQFFGLIQAVRLQEVGEMQAALPAWAKKKPAKVVDVKPEPQTALPPIAAKVPGKTAAEPKGPRKAAAKKAPVRRAPRKAA